MALSAIEIAQKQRHLYLLTRVKNNQPLNHRELKELTELEKMVKKQRTVKPKKKKATKGKAIEGRNKSAGGGNKPAKGDRELAALAKELKSVAALDEKFEEHFDLEKYPRIKTALEEAVSKRIEDIIRQRFEGKKYRDYRRVNLQQLTEITGTSRRTIYDWMKKGLPREADNSFDLAKFIKWFEQYTIEKLPPQVVAAANPYQRKRVEKLDLDIAEQKRRLLDRNTVLAGFVARWQQLVNSFQHKAEELAIEAHGQPQGKITEILREFFEQVLTAQCQVPEELYLPEKAAQQFQKLLDGLRISD